MVYFFIDILAVAFIKMENNSACISYLQECKYFTNTFPSYLQTYLFERNLAVNTLHVGFVLEGAQVSAGHTPGTGESMSLVSGSSHHLCHQVLLTEHRTRLVLRYT